MTSTPVSINDESLNGSWIDINSASQIHSPIDNDSPEYLRPPHSVAESVQNLGIISFQVERFLQEAQKINNEGNSNNGNQQQQQPSNVDNISDMYLSDSELSVEGQPCSKTLIENLRKYQKRRQNNPRGNNNDNFVNQMSQESIGGRLSKSGECLLDQVSDSLSMLSRASFMATDFGRMNQASEFNNQEFQDFDWLWDWTTQPEYFAGHEWKMSSSSKQQQEFLLRQQRNYCAGQHDGAKNVSGEMMSLLVLSNLLSIIIGAGLTYSILKSRPTV